MARSPILAVAFVMATLTLAGCMTEDVQVEDTPTEAAKAEATEGRGAVTGQVITEALDLVPNVEVALVNRTGGVTVTTTDGQARYTFNDVVPGPYRIQVDAACCKATSVAADVPAGKVVEVSLRLPLLTEADLAAPFMVPHQWDGFVSCDVSAFSAGVQLCGQLGDPNHDSSRDFEVLPGLQELVIGMEWDENTLAPAVYGNALGLHMLRIVDECEGCDPVEERECECTWLYVRIDESSPIVTYVHDANIDNDTRDFGKMEEPWNMRFNVFSGATNVVYQQAYTLYWYEFYHQRAPVDFHPLPSEQGP